NGHNGNYTAAQFIEAIPDSGGIISTIAKRVGCAWNTARKYIDDHPTVQQAYQDERNKVGDMLETTALSIAKNGDGTMLRFFLSTVWKDRGYVIKEERDIRGTLDMVQMTPEQWRAENAKQAKASADMLDDFEDVDE
ncbi:MAG: hypothetical protein KKH70_20665, partial [Gammaproteobacteria bacterium]|nr:hypothetical protein [Gammaproteobacteria bacterium]